jgi:histone demethylase JARID1
MDALELLVNKGRNIPVRLELLPQLESQLSGAKTWKDRTARTFLRKNSHYTLMEVSEHVVFTVRFCLSISRIHCLWIL